MPPAPRSTKQSPIAFFNEVQAELQKEPELLEQWAGGFEYQRWLQKINDYLMIAIRDFPDEKSTKDLSGILKVKGKGQDRMNDLFMETKDSDRGMDVDNETDAPTLTRTVRWDANSANRQSADGEKDELEDEIETVEPVQSNAQVKVNSSRGSADEASRAASCLPPDTGKRADTMGSRSASVPVNARPKPRMIPKKRNIVVDDEDLEGSHSPKVKVAGRDDEEEEEEVRGVESLVTIDLKAPKKRSRLSQQSGSNDGHDVPTMMLNKTKRPRIESKRLTPSPFQSRPADDQPAAGSTSHGLRNMGPPLTSNNSSLVTPTSKEASTTTKQATPVDNNVDSVSMEEGRTSHSAAPLSHGAAPASHSAAPTSHSAAPAVGEVSTNDGGDSSSRNEDCQSPDNIHSLASNATDDHDDDHDDDEKRNTQDVDTPSVYHVPTLLSSPAIHDPRAHGKLVIRQRSRQASCDDLVVVRADPHDARQTPTVEGEVELPQNMKDLRARALKSWEKTARLQTEFRRQMFQWSLMSGL